MGTLYIVLIVVVVIIILFFLMRGRLTYFRAGAKIKRGESELPSGIRQPPPTRISRNRMMGNKQKIKIDNPNKPKNSENRE